MKIEDQLAALARVSEARYLAEYRAIRDLLAEEERLQGQIDRLARQALEIRENRTQPGAMQMLGVDILWERTLHRNRAQLNLQLARLRAQKADALEKVRAAFGRKMAVEDLADRVALRTRRDQAERDRQAALQLWLSRKVDRGGRF